MKLNALKTISNIAFAYSLIVGGIIIYQRIESALQGGACPLPTQRPWLYSAIAAALLSMALGHISEKKSKNPKVENQKEKRNTNSGD